MMMMMKTLGCELHQLLKNAL